MQRPRCRFEFADALLVCLHVQVGGQFEVVLLGAPGDFFQKRRLFPRWCITYWLAALIIGIADALGAQMVNPSTTFTQDLSRSLMQAAVYAFIWIPYMRKSRRVKATFVR